MAEEQADGEAIRSTSSGTNQGFPWFLTLSILAILAGIVWLVSTQ